MTVGEHDVAWFEAHPACLIDLNDAQLARFVRRRLRAECDASGTELWITDESSGIKDWNAALFGHSALPAWLRRSIMLMGLRKR